VAGRVLRLAYFTSQPSGLLTALCENGDRVDLLVIPPQTARETADAAMILAATTRNLSLTIPVAEQTKPRHIDVGRSQDSDTALSGGDRTVSGQAAVSDRQ
jgi:Family of unknown function (DUF5994)